MEQAQNYTCGKKYRKFFITFWNEVNILEHENIVYACQCFDKCSEEHDGKFHGHAFIYFKTPRTWKLLKDHYGNDCHIEIPFKNSDAINYIMSEEHEHAKNKYDRVEYGEKPMDNGQKKTVKEAMNLTDEEISELSTKEAVHILRIRNELKCEDMDVEDFHKDVKVYYIYSKESGKGKTLEAVRIIKENGGKFCNVKYENGFYSGIKNHKCKVMLYDDFRDSHMKASEFINMIDYNKHTMNIKGGSEVNDFNIIIITSIQHINNLYRNLGDEPKKQWLRRITFINLDEEDECEDMDVDDLIV